MKRRFLVVLAAILFLPTIAGAEEQATQPAAKSRLEAFMSGTGRVLVRSFKPIGNLTALYAGKLEIEGIIAYSPGEEDQRRRGLNIKATAAPTSTYSRGDKSSAFIDLDELADLISSIDYIESAAVSMASTTEYTEIDYRTRAGIKVGFYIDRGKVQRFIEVGTIRKVNTFLPEDGLKSIKNFLISGREYLNTH